MNSQSNSKILDDICIKEYICYPIKTNKEYQHIKIHTYLTYRTLNSNIFKIAKKINKNNKSTISLI